MLLVQLLSHFQLRPHFQSSSHLLVHLDHPAPNLHVHLAYLLIKTKVLLSNLKDVRSTHGFHFDHQTSSPRYPPSTTPPFVIRQPQSSLQMLHANERAEQQWQEGQRTTSPTKVTEYSTHSLSSRKTLFHPPHLDHSAPPLESPTIAILKGGSYEINRLSTTLA